MPDFFKFGDEFELDLRAYELRSAGIPLKLKPIPMELLLFLLERRGEMVTREQIAERIWGNNVFLDTDNSINGAISKIRQVLRDDPEKPRFIQTITGRGYRFIAPLLELSPPPAAEIATLKESAAAENLAAKKISHYRIIKLLGGGGMGVVYEAEDLKLGRRVAMKFLPAEVAKDALGFERMQREARAASALDHPNICAVYELGEHEGQPFIVMQLLEGQTLREWMETAAGQRSTSQVNELLDLAVQIADGLDAAHEKAILHRDIKPANIFITNRGQAKILDFGVAKVLNTPDGIPKLDASAQETRMHPDMTLTRTGVSKGTPFYSSPEQVRGERLDARSDLFSLGLVLYEIATGHRAFPGNTAGVVFESILNQTPTPLVRLNAGLPAELERIISKALEKDRNLRYQTASEMRRELQRLKSDMETEQVVAASFSSVAVARGRKLWKVLIPIIVIFVAAAIGGAFYSRFRSATILTDKDTIVLADFSNTTGDSVFDDTLKQGLAIQLEQSPFLDLVSERKVNETLKLMGRLAGDRLTPDVAREVCQRTASKAMLTGSIAGLGSQYVIGMKVVNCETGDMLAEAQQQAKGKEDVLKALDAAAVSLRSKLGESLNSVQKYATPLIEATTPSVEALKAYSLGMKTWSTKGHTTALPFFKRAVDLDPTFAVAYASISAAYDNLGEAGRAAEYSRKAYELRGKASEPERFAIEANYHEVTTGDLEKAAQVCELWHQTYPRDSRPVRDLGLIFAILGNHGKALEYARESLQMGPHTEIYYTALGSDYTNLNRLDEADAVLKEADQRKLESEGLLAVRYRLAFVKGDAVQMAQLAASGTGKLGTEDLLLAAQADTEAWYGKLKNARELTQRAVLSAQHNDAEETAAIYQAAAALREVESGNRKQARANVKAAMKLAPNRDVREMAALVLARAGGTTAAEKLAAELDKTFPLDTIAQRYWLPSIRAAVALQRKDLDRAIELLETASTIELGQATTTVAISLYPVYLRGEAYLMLHDGKLAVAEFQKFIDHRGGVGNSQLGSLAWLGLARAYALDAAKGSAARDRARTAYQEFLVLWKDADPDIPILREAKAEYAKLQWSATWAPVNPSHN